VTELDYHPAELAAFEAEFADDLAISSQVADLLFRDAHTANAFTSQPVSEAKMQAVYDLIKWGPTAMNTQPLRVALVRTPDARESLVAHMSEGNKAKTLAAPLVAVLAADVDFHDELHRTFPVFPGAAAVFADEASRHTTATLNSALQIGYFLIGLRAAGLAAGPMTGFDADAMSQEFFPDGRHRALVVVNIGEPSDQAFRPRLPRLDYAEVVTEF
jgi:nitroreductase